jgi:hypothetical protein
MASSFIPRAPRRQVSSRGTASPRGQARFILASEMPAEKNPPADGEPVLGQSSRKSGQTVGTISPFHLFLHRRIVTLSATSGNSS